MRWWRRLCLLSPFRITIRGGMRHQRAETSHSEQRGCGVLVRVEHAADYVEYVPLQTVVLHREGQTRPVGNANEVQIDAAVGGCSCHGICRGRNRTSHEKVYYLRHTHREGQRQGAHVPATMVVEFSSTPERAAFLANWRARFSSRLSECGWVR